MNSSWIPCVTDLVLIKNRIKVAAADCLGLLQISPNLDPVKRPPSCSF